MITWIYPTFQEQNAGGRRPPAPNAMRGNRNATESHHAPDVFNAESPIYAAGLKKKQLCLPRNQCLQRTPKVQSWDNSTLPEEHQAFSETLILVTKWQPG
ncbi:hypothetical protein N7541_001969 [Penicillium brevicompactum]|uniref:Uncharacterized protein n=1 Tax=Penicillium brevicompactum TaxID=5074 RepID=A0A9W9RKB1_PENBR|nr:hypothetical protein N7541_001969 [Penicillium brevicompactum]